MAPFSLPAPAKLNLFLHINGRRPDGYHLLQTLFVLLDHGDTLDFAPADTLSLRCDNPALPVDDDNLVLRAARLLQQETGHAAGARLHLRKRLPAGGGVGGGETANTPLSDIALKWMADEARENGLAIDYAVLDSRLEPNPLAAFKIPGGLLSALGDRVRQAPAPSADAMAQFHPSVWVRFDHVGSDYRPESMRGWADVDRSDWG